jgi:hypothetical protein
MLRNRLSIFVAALVIASPLGAQTPEPGNGLAPLKALDHADYDIWNRITGQALSADGRLVLFHQVAEANDPLLIVQPLASGSAVRVERAEGARFSRDGRYVVFRIKPSKATIEEEKKKGTRADRMPKDSLGILDVASGQVITRVPRLKTFAMPEKASGWVAFHVEKDEPASADSAGAGEQRGGVAGARPGGQRPGGATGESGDRKDEGTPLVVRNLTSGDEHRIH